MLNKAILQGRLAADPELKYTANDIPVCSFRIAVPRSKSRDGEQATDWISVVAWRQTAEFVSQYFAKGKMILVEGRIQAREYTAQDGGKRSVTEVVAEKIYFCGKGETGLAPDASQDRRGEYNAISGVSKYAPHNMYENPGANADGFAELHDFEDDNLPF